MKRVLALLFFIIIGISLSAVENKTEIVVQTGHTGEILGIEFVNNGANFLTESDGVVKLWDTYTGKILKTYATQLPFAYTLYKGINNSVHIAYIKFDKTFTVNQIRFHMKTEPSYSILNLIDYKSGKNIEPEKFYLKYPANNDYVLGFRNEKLLNIQNKVLFEVTNKESSDYYRYCMLSPDLSMYVACYFGIPYATLFDFKSGKPIRKIDAYVNRTRPFFSKSGAYFAVTTVDYDNGKFAIYKKDGSLVLLRDEGIYGDISTICFLNDDEHVAIAGKFRDKERLEKFAVKILNFKTNTYKDYFADHGLVSDSNKDISKISYLAFTEDDKYMITGTGDSRLFKWDIENNSSIALSKLKIGNFKSHYSGDKSKIATLFYQGQIFYDKKIYGTDIEDYNGNLLVWDLKTCKNIKTSIVKISEMEHPRVGLLNDGNILLYGREIGGEYLKPYNFIDLKTDNIIKIANDNFSGKEIEALDFSTKSNLAVFDYTYSPTPYSMTTKIAVVDFNLKKPKILKNFTFPYEIIKFPERSRPCSVAISKDEKMLAVRKLTDKLIIYDIKSFSKISAIEVGEEVFNNAILGFSNKSDIFYLNSNNFKGIHLYDTQTGKLIKNIDTGRTSYSCDFSIDDKYFIESGEGGFINIYKTDDWSLFKKLEDDKFGYFKNARFMPDNKFLLCQTSDNSFRIWNIETEQWVTILKSADGDEWIVYDSDGYWDSSANGGDLVAMVSGLNCWNIDQFAVKNNRPDLIFAKLPFGDNDLVTHYKSQYLKRLKKLGFVDKNGNPDESLLSEDFHVPEAKIIESKQNDKFVNIQFTLNDSKYDIKRYNIFVNDVPLFGAYGKSFDALRMALDDKKKYILSEKIELTTGQNKIEVSCMNEKGAESYRALTMASYNPPKSPFNKGGFKPDLYYIGFGVSKYKDASLNLNYADKDAKDLADLYSKMKNQYANIYTHTFVNEECTVENIRKAKELLKNAKPDDAFVLFIAGHGIHDTDKDATYYYVTYDTDINILSQTAANFDIIEDIMQGIPPRNKLFLMDTCESGEIDDEVQLEYFAMADKRGIKSRAIETERALKKKEDNSKKTTKRAYLFEKDRYIYNDLVRRSGAIVFSSCKGGEFSYESDDIKNGFFTSKIIESLSGSSSDKDKDGIISTDELREYVTVEVPKLADGKQNPTVDRDNIYQTFGFQVVK